MTPDKSTGRGQRGGLLGVAAYALVPGKRRRKAAGHFRRAGFEALKGVVALARPDRTPDDVPETRRERIEVR